MIPEEIKIIIRKSSTATYALDPLPLWLDRACNDDFSNILAKNVNPSLTNKEVREQSSNQLLPVTSTDLRQDNFKCSCKFQLKSYFIYSVHKLKAIIRFETCFDYSIKSKFG